jgi:hypothetical protein
VDLEVLDLDVLPHVFGQHLHDGALAGAQPDVGPVAFHLPTPEIHIFALAEVSLEVVLVTGHVMELNERGLLLIKGMHLQIVLVKNNLLDIPLILVDEDIRIDLPQHIVLT